MLSNTFNSAGSSTTRKTTVKTRYTIDNSEISVHKCDEDDVAKHSCNQSPLLFMPVCEREESSQECANLLNTNVSNTTKTPVRKEYFRFVKSSEYSDSPVNSAFLNLKKDLPDVKTRLASTFCLSSAKQQNGCSSVSKPERISSPHSISSLNESSLNQLVNNSPVLHLSNKNQNCELPLPTYHNKNLPDDENVAESLKSPRISPMTKKRNTQMKRQEALKKRRLQALNYDSVRRSKRNIKVTVCYNEEKVTATNTQLNEHLNKSISSSSFNKQIRVGPSYQVDFLSTYLKDSENESKIDPTNSNYADRDEPLWLSNDRIVAPQLEDFCTVAKRHQNLETDDAMYILFLHDYSITDALTWLEKYQPKYPAFNWTAEEKKVFEKLVSRNSKAFNRVAKALPNKTISDVVEYYYRVKKMRCFTTPFAICPFRSKILTPDSSVPVSRSECINCLQSLYKKIRNEGRGRPRKVPLCLACELYMKLTKSHRPFGIKLVKNEENTSPPPISQKSNNSCSENSNNQCKNIEIKNVKEKHCNEFCYFKPRIEQLNRREKWNDDEILLCVKAIKKYGAKWELVAAELPGKTVHDIAEFYSEYQFIYRLDFLINVSGKCSNELATTGHSTLNSSSTSLTNGRGRRKRNSSSSLNNNTIFPDDEKVLLTRQKNRIRRGASQGNTVDKLTDSETDIEKKENEKEEQLNILGVGSTSAASCLSLVTEQNVAQRYVYRTRTRKRQQQ